MPTLKGSLATVGTLRFAHPTNLASLAMTEKRETHSPPSIWRPIRAMAFW